MTAAKEHNVKTRPMERRDIAHSLAMFKKRAGARGILTHRDLINSDLGGPLDLSFVAEIDGQIIGLLLGRFAFLGIPVAESGIIQVLIVDPDYERRHVGALLVDAVLDRCNTEGVKSVRAYIDQQDWQLKTFAENFGFRPSGLIEYVKAIES